MTKLPPRAAAKLAALLDSADEAHALLTNSTRQISELEKALKLNPLGDNAAEFEAEIVRLRSSQATHQRRYAERANLVGQLRLFIQRNPALEAAPPLRPKVAQGETVNQSIASVRDTIAKAQQQLRLVQSSSLPKADLKKMAASHVRELAERGRPRLNAGRGGFTVGFTPIENAPGYDVPSILAWLDSDTLLRRLEKEIDTLPDSKLALSANDKVKRENELIAQIDELERSEEGLIELAAEQGYIIERRPNASPAAVLGVRSRAAVRAA
jgi:hypothetical protein